jgi:hypothetical protein
MNTENKHNGTELISIMATTELLENLDKQPTKTDNPLSDERDLLGAFQKDVERSGLVGEKENAATLFLCATSAASDRPLNVSVHGESSVGKNYLIEMATQAIPEENKISLTGMTPKALMHAEPDEYKHKVIIIAEYEGAKGADYAIRTFQSEKQIQWDFVDKGTKGIQKKKKIVNGPAAFIQATTRPVLHPENETRLLFVSPDESPEQTRAILRRQAAQAARGEIIDKAVIFGKWHEFIRSLNKMQVTIPFAEHLAEAFPVDRPRFRRDFSKFLGLIEYSANLHQLHRPNDGGAIFANNDDYQTAKRLFENSYETGPDQAVGDLLCAAEALGAFCVADMMQRLGWGQSKAYMVLERAKEIGCVGEGAERGKYIFIRRSTIPPLNLPDSV